MIRPLLCCALFALAACSKPEPPEKERPVDPQAKQAPTDLPTMIQVPMDQAQKIQDGMEDAEQKRKDVVDAAEDG
jgi:hypothetical protein